MNRTKRGLLVRATVQNREMAAALGVNTRLEDGFTFALGAGLAGIAGCALTLIGGVTPDMGQNYIVDAFLVVVTGGVGEIETRALLARRISIIGIFVDSRRSFENLVEFLATHDIRPVIGAELPFEQLPDALRLMQSAEHFGKIVINGPTG